MVFVNVYGKIIAPRKISRKANNERKYVLSKNKLLSFFKVYDYIKSCIRCGENVISSTHGFLYVRQTIIHPYCNIILRARLPS